MKKSLKIFIKLCELNLKKLITYRASFFISLVLMSAWVFAYVTLIEVIFYHTKTLAGWGKGEVLLIMGFYYLVQNISDIFFKENFEEFGEVVRRGDLDVRIIKPVHTRLLAFFWTIRFDHAAGIIITSVLITYALRTTQTAITLMNFAFGLGLVAISLILYFSILSIIATITFWVERNETFNTLIFNISQLSRYPRQIYGKIVGKILTFGLPVAFIASFPAEVALGAGEQTLLLFFFGVTTVFYILSRIFWNYGIKKYTSAS